MKKILMGFAACALIMTSCQKSDVIENITDGQGQLSFGVGTQQQGTRAAELNNTTMQTKVGTTGIVLNAYQNVSSAWSKWYTDKVVWNKNSSGKWELDGSVRFRNTNATKYITYYSEKGLVTAPTGFDTPNFTSTFPKFTYNVAANSVTQEDLIAGITKVEANKTDITLGMRHILSQVNFGTVGYEGAKIQIRNIQILGVKNAGDFTYRAANTYPIGDWTPTTATTNYDYYNNGGYVANNPHREVPVDAVKGDKYIFGDGGNWGPGKTANTWYPVGASGAWLQGNSTSLPTTGMSNSLMLLPQDLVEGTKVTFEYKIQDVNNAYVAGGPNDTDWAKGEFKLDFSTGTTSGTHYNSKWEQNYRYVYLIDFTDFLDGIALTFKVDVDMYEWENYNKNDDNDGIVDVMSAGQPSEANMNAIKYNGTTAPIWYIATQSEAKPTDYDPAKWAQVVRDEIWDLSKYNFTNIDVNEILTLSFENVIFNTDGETKDPTKITLTLPEGYEITNGAGITMTGSNPYVINEGNKGATATVTIKNISNYTEKGLEAAVKAINTPAQTIHYKGKAIDLTAIDNTNLALGQTIKVKFTNLITPTVGATTNGIWTWDAATTTATWTKLTWRTLSAAKTDVGNGITTNIYCSDVTDITLATALEEPTPPSTNSPITVIFSKAATRVKGKTEHGIWDYNAVTKTATWTIIWNNFAGTQTKIIGASANAFIYSDDATTTDLTTFGEPTTATNSPVKIVFKDAASRNGGTTTNGNWTYDAAKKIATWTKWLNLADAKIAFGNATAGATIYCSDATDIDMTEAFIEPTNAVTMTKDDVVTVVFKDANANRVVGAGTTNGVWATTDNTTYTWTRN